MTLLLRKADAGGSKKTLCGSEIYGCHSSRVRCLVQLQFRKLPLVYLGGRQVAARLEAFHTKNMLLEPVKFER